MWCGGRRVDASPNNRSSAGHSVAASSRARPPDGTTQGIASARVLAGRSTQWWTVAHARPRLALILFVTYIESMIWLNDSHCKGLLTR